MRKKIISFITVIFLVCVACFAAIKINSKKSDNDLKKVVVAEVAHSIFYAPQYVALGLGYFEDEGLDIDLVLASGADNVMSAVLSGDADIGFSGTEATIYVYNGGEKDYWIFLFYCYPYPFSMPASKTKPPMPNATLRALTKNGSKACRKALSSEIPTFRIIP